MQQQPTAIFDGLRLPMADNLAIASQLFQDVYTLWNQSGVIDWVPESDLSLDAIPLIGAGMGVIGAGIEGAIINTNIRLFLHAIKVAGAYCRGEQDLAQDELLKSLTVALEGLQGGFVRGTAIRLIETLTGNNVVAALGFVVCTEAMPALLKVMQNEITLEQAIADVGPRVFTSGVITTIVLLFPQIGTLMFGVTVIEAIWSEISPEWKENLQQTINAAISPPRYRTAGG